MIFHVIVLCANRPFAGEALLIPILEDHRRSLNIATRFHPNGDCLINSENICLFSHFAHGPFPPYTPLMTAIAQELDQRLAELAPPAASDLEKRVREPR